MTITKDNRWSAPYVDLEDTFYGRPDIPIGVVHRGKTHEDAKYTRTLSQSRDSAGNYVFPHRITDGSDAPDAVALLQRILEQQPDDSVTIVQIGFSTNLTRLLKESGGPELVKRKVKLLCLMAGNFARPEPEYNVSTDADSAQYLFANWPTPMIFSGFEIGEQVTFSYESILKDFNYTDTPSGRRSLQNLSAGRKGSPQLGFDRSASMRYGPTGGTSSFPKRDGLAWARSTRRFSLRTRMEIAGILF